MHIYPSYVITALRLLLADRACDWHLDGRFNNYKLSRLRARDGRVRRLYMRAGGPCDGAYLFCRVRWYLRLTPGLWPAGLGLSFARYALHMGGCCFCCLRLLGLQLRAAPGCMRARRAIAAMVLFP